MTFIENAWYVAGWSREFSETPVAATILDQDIVLFRATTGMVSALEDSCPHKGMPLSRGRLQGDYIQCGYHGVTFDGHGHCVRIPGQTNLPATAAVRSYPIVERHQIVWIWMGEAKQADPDLIFDMPELDDPAWHGHQGDALDLAANYLNVAENLVDPAHVSFVHPTTLGNTASEDIQVEFDTDGEAIVAWRWIRQAPPVGFFQEYGNFTGDVDRWHYYYLYLPCTAVIDFGSADSHRALPPERRHEGVQIYALHFMTPVDQHRTIDRWMHLRNTAIGDDQVSAKMDAMFRIAFNEDKVILEALERAEAKPQRRRPLKLAIDRGSNAYRNRIKKLLSAQASTHRTGETPSPGL